MEFVMPGFMGMRGTGDWVTDARPKSWRETILYLYPNGKAPLTALLSKMASEKVDDPEFNWWTQQFTSQSFTPTGVYTDSGLSSAYVSGGDAGDVIYVKGAEDSLKEFRAGHQIMLRVTSDLTADVIGKVTAVTYSGSSSYLTVKLLEADDNGTSDMSDCDRVMVVGNINSEGADMPSAVAYDETKWYNYTQIFRTPLSITRTARKTRLRTEDAYQKMKREALEMHSVEMEKAFLFGIASENIGDNGKPERTTLGLLNAIKGGGTGHAGSDFAGMVTDFRADNSGSTWLANGEDWLDTRLEELFRYGDNEKLMICGSGVLLGINKLVKNGGNFDFSAQTTSYGIKINRWETAFGTINLLSHPLFNLEPSLRNTGVAFEPKGLKYRFIDDTEFYDDKKNKNTGHNHRDSTDEEFLTEAGLEYHHPISWGYFKGVGLDG
jgi:hypothetical protein